MRDRRCAIRAEVLKQTRYAFTSRTHRGWNDREWNRHICILTRPSHEVCKADSRSKVGDAGLAIPRHRSVHRTEIMICRWKKVFRLASPSNNVIMNNVMFIHYWASPRHATLGVFYVWLVSLCQSTEETRHKIILPARVSAISREGLIEYSFKMLQRFSTAIKSSGRLAKRARDCN